MYGIFTYIYHKNQPNVDKYAIHGWYGKYISFCNSLLLNADFPASHGHKERNVFFFWPSFTTTVLSPKWFPFNYIINWFPGISWSINWSFKTLLFSTVLAAFPSINLHFCYRSYCFLSPLIRPPNETAARKVLCTTCERCVENFDAGTWGLCWRFSLGILVGFPIGFLFFLGYAKSAIWDSTARNNIYIYLSIYHAK